MDANTDICYICYMNEDEEAGKFARDPPPCKCQGSIILHKTCLQDQITRDILHCTICQTPFHDDYIINSNMKLYNILGYMVKETRKYTWPGDGNYGEIEKLYYDADENGFLEIYSLNMEYCTEYYTILNGKRNGPAYTYHGNGTVSCVYTYVNDICHGKYSKYYNDGIFYESGYYHQGVISGLVRKYMKSSLKDDDIHLYNSIGYYHNGEKEGIFYTMSDIPQENPDGGCYIRHSNYFEGMKHGPQYEYENDAYLSYRVHYNFGMKDGVVQAWYDNGNIQKIYHMYHNTVAGLFRNYHPNGQIKSLDYLAIAEDFGEGDDDDYFYKTDTQILSHDWYENGQLRNVQEPERSIGWHWNGQVERLQYKKEGLYRLWHEDGSMRAIHYFQGGVLDSKDITFQSWKMDGSLIIYKDDESDTDIYMSASDDE